MQDKTNSNASTTPQALKKTLSKEKFPIQNTGDSEKKDNCDTHGTRGTSQNSLRIGRYTAAVKNTSVRNQRKTAAATHTHARTHTQSTHVSVQARKEHGGMLGQLQLFSMPAANGS